MTRRVLPVLLAGLALAAVRPAAAGLYPVFGPEDFQQPGGKPFESSRTFSVPVPGVGYRLVIENGGGAGRFSRAGNVRVTLNGTVAVKDHELDPSRDRIERPVTLAAKNVLEVRLAGKPATTAGIRLTVFGTDDEPPAIVAAVAPPANAAGWHFTPLTVSFTCSDRLSGIATCPGPVRVETEGEQVVSGTAVDRAGNRATAQVQVRMSFDHTPPSVELLAPADGLETNAPAVVVRGRASDDRRLAAVEVAGTPVEPGPDGAFVQEIPLADGDNRLTATARDAAGNTASATVRVGRFALPEVAITAPAAQTLTATPTVEVRGTAGATAAVEVNGIPARMEKGAFTALVPLFEGDNTLTAVARDARGRSATTSVSVIRDSTAPRLAIHAPADGWITAAGAVTVTGMVNDLIVGNLDQTEARVEVNGRAAAVDNRSFSASGVPLAPGENTLTVTATDLAGNVGRATVKVVRESPAAGRPVLRPVAGDLQEGVIGAELPQALEVEVLDATGRPLAGRPVLFRVADNDGRLRTGEGPPAVAVQATTDAVGLARARWTLGSRSGPGRNRVEATVEGIEGAVSFTASGRPAAGAAVYLDAGNRQIGVVGQPLPQPLVVAVTDAGHNRLENVPVTFRVTEGGGSFAGRPEVTVPTDAYGRALAALTLGPGPGVEANVVEADFPGNAGAKAVFLATGLLAGNPEQTRVSGVVLDNTDRPVAGVTMHITETALSVRTDAQGQFTLAPAPVGRIRLIADGGTAERPGTWPSLEYWMVTVPGQDNRLTMPVYLLPLDLEHGRLVDETRGAALTLPELPGFQLDIAPGSASFPGGGRSGTVSVTLVHSDRVPMVPNFGQQPRLVVTIQPSGVRFDPPAALTVPNVEGLAPNAVTEMYSFDHDLGRFVSIGTGTVSSDGSVIRSDPGVGVIEGGWHCAGNPAAAGSAEPVRVTMSPFPEELVLAADQEMKLAATGRPAPGSFRWSVGGTAALSGPADTDSASLTASPGQSSVSVTYTCSTTGATATRTLAVVVPEVRIVQLDPCPAKAGVVLTGAGAGLFTLHAKATDGRSHLLHTITAGPGNYSIPLAPQSLPVGFEVSSIEARWTLAGTLAEVTVTDSRALHLLSLGPVQRVQHKIPGANEPTCGSSNPVNVCLVDDSEGSCSYRQVSLPSRLLTEIASLSRLNPALGIGATEQYGCIQIDSECAARDEGPRPGDCPEPSGVPAIPMVWRPLKVPCQRIPQRASLISADLRAKLPGRLTSLCVQSAGDGSPKEVMVPAPITCKDCPVNSITELSGEMGCGDDTEEVHATAFAPVSQ